MWSLPFVTAVDGYLPLSPPRDKGTSTPKPLKNAIAHHEHVSNIAHKSTFLAMLMCKYLAMHGILRPDGIATNRRISAPAATPSIISFSHS